MTLTTTIQKKCSDGNLRYHIGKLAFGSGDVSGDVATGLRVVDYFDANVVVKSGVSGLSIYGVDEIFPTTNSITTHISSGVSTAIWIAWGRV